jgi:hypothetical protein
VVSNGARCQGVQLNGRLVQWQSSAPSASATSSGPASTAIGGRARDGDSECDLGWCDRLLTFNVRRRP